MKHSDKKAKVIVLFGPPGAGKGTQAELLSQNFNLFQWETSEIIGRIIERAKKGEFVVIKGKKYHFEEQKKIRQKGGLWDGEFVFYFTKKKVEELAREGKGIVMSGSPRNVEEGEKLVSLLKKLYGFKNIAVVVLEVSPEATIWRNSRRRECQLATHSILYNKETKNLTKCPVDGSKLMRRKDDKPEVIRKRLKEYKEKTFPLVLFFKKQGFKVNVINGEQSVADVFSDILSKLKTW